LLLQHGIDHLHHEALLRLGQAGNAFELLLQIWRWAALAKVASGMAALGLMVVALGLLEARFLSGLGKALLAIRVVNRLSRYHETQAPKDSEPDVVVQAALTQIDEQAESCAT
jgi:hypothetical protein